MMGDKKQYNPVTASPQLEQHIHCQLLFITQIQFHQQKSMILNTLHSFLCIVTHKCINRYVHFSYFFYTPESSSETAQSFVSIHIFTSDMQTAEPGCLHTRGLFLERRSVRFTNCPKGSFKLEYYTWEKGSKLAPTPMED